MSALILRHTIEVRRAARLSPAAVDEWNQPVYGAATAVLVGPAGIEPLTMDEVASLTDAGAQIGDFRAITPLEGILPSDSIQWLDTRQTLQIRSVLAFRRTTELLLRLVTP